jgi:hypothetical protein
MTFQEELLILKNNGLLRFSGSNRSFLAETYELSAMPSIKKRRLQPSWCGD